MQTRAPVRRNRFVLWLVLFGVIATGVVSRTVQSGSVLFDKYLGDALYAIMLYVVLALVWPRARAQRLGLAAGLAVLAIECFQLTLIPQQLTHSGRTALVWLAIALGTEFSGLDIAAYALGIGCAIRLDLGFAEK